MKAVRSKAHANRRSHGRSVLIIGVGRAGGNIFNDIRRSNALEGIDFKVRWISLCTGPPHERDASKRNSVPVVANSFEGADTSGSAQLGQALAYKHRYLFRALLAGADIAVLVIGLGGGTGGGMFPYVARLARIQGVLTIAMVTMPFAFEGIRVQRANIALKRLKRQTTRVIAFSNQGLANEMGNDAMLETTYEVQSRRIACLLRMLLRRWRGHLRR